MAISTREVYLILRARDEASRIIRGFGGNLSRTGVMLQQFGAAAIATGTGIATLGAGGLAFMKSNMDVAAEYDRQVRNALSQADLLGVGLEEVAEIGRGVAREIGVPFEQIQDTLFFIFGTMRVGIEDAEMLLHSFAKEAVAGQTSMQDAGRSTIAIINGLGMEIEDVTRIQDVLFQLIRKGDITYEELSRSIGKTISATNRAGQEIETTAAMMAFLTRTGLSASEAATSAARALETISDPRVQGRLEKMGIEIESASGGFRPLVDIIKEMNQEMEGLSKPERTEWLQELFLRGGGTRQARRFWETALGGEGQFEAFLQDIDDMGNATGAFQERYDLMSDAVSTQTEELRNKWMLVKEALGRAVIPAFLDLIEVVEGVLEWFDRLPESTKEMVGLFITWGSVAAIVVGAFLILIGTLGFFAAGLILAGKALAIIFAVMAVVITAAIAFGLALYAAWQNSQGFRDIVDSIVDGLKTLWGMLVDGAMAAKESFEENLLPTLERLWQTIEEKVLPIILDLIEKFKEHIKPAAEDVGAVLKDVLDWALNEVAATIEEYLIPAINNLNAWYRENEEEVDKIIGVLVEFVKIILIVAGSTVIGILIGGLVTVIGLVGMAINSFITTWQTIKDLINWIGKLIDWLNRARDWFDEVVGASSDATETIRGLKDVIANAFSNPLSLLHGAGSDIIQGLINGIKSMVPSLGAALGEITRIIPEEKGPRERDRKLLRDAGRQVMRGFMEGISETVPALRDQLRDITTDVDARFQPAPVGDVRGSEAPASRDINQTFNISTQEIDPVFHAEQLGWLVAVRR